MIQFRSLVDDPNVKIKYQHLITKSFVECNRLMRWCPAPNCSNVIKVQYSHAQQVQCLCGHVFCFGCGELCHEPIECRWLKEWLKKSEMSLKTALEEKASSNWVAVNTKECPKCHVKIEKNGGSDHVICNCLYEFCWICLGAWKSHICNRIVCEKFSDPKDDYLHYYNRYINHHQSLLHEQNLSNSIIEKMKQMLLYNMSWVEVRKSYCLYLIH